MNLSEKAKNWFGTAKDGFGTSKSCVEGKVSDEQRDLLIKICGALLLCRANGYSEVFVSTVKFITGSASNDDGCTMPTNKLEKGEISVEEEIETKVSISDEDLDLLIKVCGALLLSPVFGSSEGCGSAIKFILTSSASDDDGCTMAKNKLEKGEISVEEEIGTNVSISAEDLNLLIKAGGAALLSPATGSSEGCGSAVKFILTNAASHDDGCTMAKNKLEKGEISVEEEIRTKGTISPETLDLLIKAGRILILVPVLGYYGGVASAGSFILNCAPSAGDCLEMVGNRFEKIKSWTETAKNWYGTSKNWAEEKIRATGISDEQRDFVLKGGGALLGAAAAMGYLRGKIPRSYFRG